MTRIGEVVAKVPGQKSAAPGRRAAPAGHHQRPGSRSPSSCAGNASSTHDHAERLADACAHTLLDAITRVPEIPDELSHAMATARHQPQ